MKGIFERKIFIRFLLSYLFILFLPLLVVGMVNIFYNSRLLTEKARQESMDGILQAGRKIDREFAQLDEISFALGRNASVRRVLFEVDEITRHLAKRDSLQEMQVTNTTQKFTDDIFIYIQRDDAFLITTSYYGADLLFDKYRFDSITPQDMVAYTREAAVTLRRVTAGGGQNRYLLYTRNIPAETESYHASVMMLINYRNIADLFPPALGEAHHFILAEDGAVLFADGSHEIAARLDLRAQPGISEQVIDGRRFLVVTADSKAIPARYVSMIAMSDVLSGVTAMRHTLAWTLSICLLFGLVAAFLLSERNYRPIRGIFDMIFRGDGAAPAEDFSFALSRLGALVGRKAELEHHLQNQLPAMQVHFISSLLTGRIALLEERREEMRLLQLEFVSGSFCVARVHVDDSSGFSGGGSGGFEGLARFAVGNVLMELLEDLARVFPCEQEDDSVFLLNLLPGRAECPEELAQRLREFQDIMGEKLGIRLSIGVGGAVDSPAEIARSHTEAAAALNQRFLRGTGTLAVYQSAESQPVGSYYYPVDREARLLNLIKSGDEAAARAIIDEIYHENITNRRLPLKVVTCLAFDMIATMLKVLDETAVPFDAQGQLQELLEVDTIEQVRGSVLKTLSVTCEAINRSRESGNIRLREDILGYIALNYADQGLSLQSIADRFGVSASYLSRYFKDQTGQNAADYISRFRVAKAKELLRGELTIAEIAAAVGYNSANSFIRTFKRYESVTPGQYREQTLSSR